LAYQFINFIYEPTEYAKISDYLGIGNISIPARQLNKRKLHYTTADLAKTELKADLGPHLPVYTKLWESIRVQN
jgi:spermidine/putrescine-binding protein